mgnify:CR=1 FL=1
MGTLFLEAESFRSPGGWVIDSASVLQMGSAYLMAHGAGVPVADAETGIELAQSAHYHVHVRTRDWTAVWGRGRPAGRFRLKINGVELPAELGTNGEEWGWQYAGSVFLESGTHQLALHDLTGFNGRCDAIYFSTDAADIPPDGGPELERFRKEKSIGPTLEGPCCYDLIVVGGGIAGCCAALAAARLGLRALLIHDRPVLGGCNSSEVRVPLGGATHVGKYPNIGNTVREIGPLFLNPGVMDAAHYEDLRKENAFLADCAGKADLRLNEQAVSVELDPDHPGVITAVIARGTVTGKETRYRGRFFADCSGDGAVALQSGAAFLYGTEGREAFGETLAPKESSNEVMGLSVLWKSVVEPHPVPFPEIDWGIEFTEENCYYVTDGNWETETGQYRNQAEEAEYIRDYSLMTTYANWSFLKNRSRRKAEWASRRISWISACGGKRESRRIVGDCILTQNDIESRVEYPDGTASLSWSFDLHYPEPENKERFTEPFRSCAYHRSLPDYYPVPYRCLYARDVKNLFLGGRLLSLSHVAFSSARVMRTLGCLGEVVAMAASICCRKNVYPRDVYDSYFELLMEKMREGIPVPEQFAHPAVGHWESYHFQGRGHFFYRSDGPLPPLDEKTKADIAKLKRDHLFEFTGR